MAAWTYTSGSGVEYFDITGVTTNEFWDVISTTLDAGHTYSISATTKSESNYDGIIISTIPLSQKTSGSLSSKYYGDNILLLCSGTSGGEGRDYTVGSSDQDIYIYFRTDTSTLSPSSEEGHVTITAGSGGGGSGSGATNEWDESVSGNTHTFTISVDEDECFAKTYYTVTNGHTYSIYVDADSEGNYDGIIVSTTNYSSRTAYSSMKSNSGCVAYASNSSNTVSYTAQTAGALYIYFVTDSSTLSPDPELGTVIITEQGAPTPTQSTLNLVGTSVNYGSTAYIRATPSVSGTIYWGYSNSSMTYTQSCTGGTTYDLTSRSSTGSTTVYAYLDPSSSSYSNSAVVNATMTVAGQNNITITLDRNGGSGGSASISVAPGASYSDYPTIYTPDRTGFGFDGYYTSKVGGTECVNDEGSPRVTAPTSDTTWYAHWINALDYSPNTSISVYSGTTSATLASEGWSCGGGSPTGSISSVKKGSTNVTNLSSWGVNSTGTTLTIPSGQATGTYTIVLSITTPSSTTGNTYIGESTTKTITLSITSQPTITITLSGNGGSGNQSSIQVTPGAAAGNWSVGTLPTRSGFEFMGYYSASTSGTQYTAPTGETNRAAPTSATTLYANWRPIISYVLLDDPEVYCTSSAESYGTADGDRTATISTAGISVPSGVSYTVSESMNSWTISSNGKTITIPDGTVADDYPLMILVDIPAGSNYRGRYDQYDGNVILVEVTKYPNDSNPTKYKNTSGTTGTNTIYGTPTCAIANTGLTAAGGSANVSCSVSDTSTWYWKYTNGVYSSLQSTPVSGTATWAITLQTFTPSGGGSATNISRFSKSSNKINHTTMGKNAGTDRVLITATNSGDTSKTNTADKYITNDVTTTESISYGIPTVEFSSDNITAAGGSIRVYCSATDDITTVYTYTSGSEETSLSYNDADVVWQITSDPNNAFYENGDTISDPNLGYVYESGFWVSHNNMGTNIRTDTFTVRAYNRGDTSKNADLSYSGVSNTSSISTSIISYGTPEVAIGTGIYADGGSATVTCSVTNTVRTTTSYTSGSSSYVDGTADGTAKWAITSNGNSAFTASGTSSSLSGVGTVYNSGGTITHEDMTNHARTDTVEVTAYNVGDTSKTATAEDVTQNNLTWKNPAYTQPGTGSSKTISLSKAGQEYTIVAAVTQQQSYTSGYVAQTVDLSDSVEYSVSTPKTGYSLNTSTHVVTVTNNESTSVRNGFKVLLRCVGNANLVKTFTVTFNQPAGSQAYMNPVVTGFTYDTFAASGATKTPTVTYYQDYAWNGVAGSGTRTENTGGTFAFGDMGITFPTGFSKGSNYATTGSATWANRTNVEGAARDCNNYLSVTVTMNSKTSNPFWCTSCVQEANALGTQHYKNTSGTTGDVITYGTPTCILNTTNLNTGDSSYYVACDVNNTVQYYRKYTSGTYTSQYSDTQAGTAKWKISSQTCAGGGTRFSNPTSGSSNLSGVGTVYTGGSGHPGAHSTMGANEGTDTINVISYNVADITKTNTATGSVTNELGTQKYKDTSGTTGQNTVYRKPDVTIGSGLTPGASSATVSCSVTNHYTYYYRYTSGTYTDLISEDFAGTATWSITTQTFTPSGGSASTITRFSKSNNTLSHSTMGTNVGTDYIKITAKNSSATSQTKTAELSLENVLTWNNPTVTYSGSTQFENTGGTITMSSSNISISQSGSYTSGSTASNTTLAGLDFAETTSKSGFTYSKSGSGTSTTASNIAANNTSTSTKTGNTITITATGSGGKTGTKAVPFTQTAGAKVYSNPSITTYTYSTTANTGATDVAPTVSYSQTWTWNGVSGSGGTITSGGTLAFTCGTGTPDRFSTGTNFATTGKITWGNNNTASAKDAKSKLSVTVTLNSKTSSAYTCTACSQSAGAKSYSTPTVNTFSYATYAASGATKSPSVTYSMPYTWNGVSADSGTDTSGGTLTYSKGTLTSGATADSSYSSNGKITWANNTTTSARSTHSVLTVTVKTPTGNLTSSAKTCTACSQSAGAKVYETPTVSGSYTYATAAASGATDATPNALPSYSQVWTWNGVSGSGGTLTSGQTVTYNYSTTGTLPTGFSTGTNFATTGKINWANNTTTSSRAAASNLKVTLTINGKTSAATTCTACTQSAGAKSYANPSITAYTYATTANTGATDVTPTVTYSQVWTWNGVSGSGGTITSGGTLAFTCSSGTPDRFSTGTNFSTTGKVTWGNNNTASAKDAKAKLTVTVTLNSKTSSSYTCSACSQSAGAKAYGTPSITAFSYATFAAAGATKTPTVTYNLPYTWNGVSADSGTDTSGGTLAYAKGTLTSGATAASNYATTGSITWANNTTTSARSTHSVLTVTVTSPTGNKTSSAYTCTACTQSAGAKVYETPTLSGSYTYATAAASGVTDASPNALPSYSQVWTWNGVSGSGGTLTSGQTVTYNYTAGTLPTGFTKGTNFATTGKINWSNNNSTSTRTATSILSVTLTINGKTSASKACTACTQSAGAKVYSNPTVTAYTYSTSVSAAGTTDLAPATLTYSQTWTWNGVSGSGGTITSGGTLAFTRATTYSWMTAGTNFATTGKINVESLGTTISNARTFAGALSVTVTLNGKTSSSQTATAGKQNGNYVVSIVTGDSSGGTGNHFSYSNIGAGATSASPSFTGGATYTFTSGSTKFDSSGSPSFGGSASYTRSFSLGTVQNGFTAVNSTSGVLTATSRGTTPGDARTSGTVTGTLVVKYTHASSYSAGGTVTAPTYTSTATCTQAANALTGLAISVGTNPINYGGTSTCTVTATYTSGATKNVDCDTNTTYSFNPTGIVTVTKS